MDVSREVQQFLTQARARLSPADVGIPELGDDRRVPGLRREEVALLAGVSITYYTRIERGRLKGVSGHVLKAIVRALRMSDPEAQHLFNLARADSGGDRAVERNSQTALGVRVQRLITSMSDVPALALGRLGDPIGGNPLGRALFPHLFPEGEPVVNHARYVFLDDRSRVFYVDWERSARRVVSVLRLLAGQDPSDRAVMALIGELKMRSDDFRTAWACHGVDTHTTGQKSIRHPVVGEVTLEFETLSVGSAPDVRIGTYLAEPETPSADALDLLRSWVATRTPKGAVEPGRVIGRDA